MSLSVFSLALYVLWHIYVASHRQCGLIPRPSLYVEVTAAWERDCTQCGQSSETECVSTVSVDITYKAICDNGWQDSISRMLLTTLSLWNHMLIDVTLCNSQQYNRYCVLGGVVVGG